MKIAVIGTINKDLILPFEGASIQSVGGIYYSISALAQIAGSQAQVVPVAFTGADFHQALVELLKQFPNVSIDGLTELPQKNHEVILEYSSPEERSEKALFNFPPLEWEHLAPFADADFFVVNFITGWDVSLDALRRLGAGSFERIYMDVHFLVMGVDKLGRRYPRCPENIGEWLRLARFVQMNEREFRIIAGDRTSDLAFYEKYLTPQQVLIITSGSRGARLIWTREGATRKKMFPPYEVPRVVDPTGCGDVFGAAFVWYYLNTGDLYAAMENANRLAAANSLLKGTNEMDKLLEKAAVLAEKED